MVSMAGENSLSYDFFGCHEPSEQMPLLDPSKSCAWYSSDDNCTQFERPQEKVLQRAKSISCNSLESKHVEEQNCLKCPKNSHHGKVDLKRFYTKNACKNIIKQSLRSIQSRRYEDSLRQICKNSGVTYDHFYKSILQYLESVSGPSALKLLLREKEIGKVFREYLHWYLTEKYLREALQKGHMRHLALYIHYKNNVLLGLLRPVTNT